MARIRSVHPGLFTDEAFVSLSDAAQIFFIGLWTEADDQGVFEWKPITLRMRLRPARDGSVEGLLAELEAANCIKRISVDGRQLGLIRNFRRFQKPKSPNCIHVIPHDFRNYVGLTDDISEIPPLMEDGGEDGEKGNGNGNADAEASVAPSKPIPSKRGTRISHDWQPSSENRDFARNRGVPPPEIDREAQKFRDHWLAKAGRDGVKLDWDATWRTWIAKACEWRGWAPATRPADGTATTWINTDDPRWLPLAERWRREKGRDPPHTGGVNGSGWHFPSEWIEDRAA